MQMVGTYLGKYECVWEVKLRWQNSRWLPSSSWVRMNEFESDWISLSQSQIWEGEWIFGMNAETRKQGVWIPRWPRWLNPRWQNSRWLTIIKLSQNEWVRVFLCWEKMAETKSVLIQHGRIQDGCHHQVEWEWMSLSQNELVWVRVRVEESVFEWIWEKKTRCLNSTMQKLNPRWQNSRWHHHQVESEWMNEVCLVQIELVWVRVRVEGDQFWQVNLREENKVSEFHNAWSWIQMVEFKMAHHHG